MSKAAQIEYLITNTIKPISYKEIADVCKCTKRYVKMIVAKLANKNIINKQATSHTVTRRAKSINFHGKNMYRRGESWEKISPHKRNLGYEYPIADKSIKLNNTNISYINSLYPFKREKGGRICEFFLGGEEKDNFDTFLIRNKFIFVRSALAKGSFTDFIPKWWAHSLSKLKSALKLVEAKLKKGFKIKNIASFISFLLTYGIFDYQRHCARCITLGVVNPKAKYSKIDKNIRGLLKKLHRFCSKINFSIVETLLKVAPNRQKLISHLKSLIRQGPKVKLKATGNLQLVIPIVKAEERLDSMKDKQLYYESAEERLAIRNDVEKSLQEFCSDDLELDNKLKAVANNVTIVTQEQTTIETAIIYFIIHGNRLTNNDVYEKTIHKMAVELSPKDFLVFSCSHLFGQFKRDYAENKKYFTWDELLHGLRLFRNPPPDKIKQFEFNFNSWYNNNVLSREHDLSKVSSYIAQIKQNKKCREVLKMAGKMIELADSKSYNSKKLLDSFIQSMPTAYQALSIAYEVTLQSRDWEDTLRDLDKTVLPISTGINKIDEKTDGGIRPEEVFIFASVNRLDATKAAYSMARTAWFYGNKRVCYISTSINKKKLLNNILQPIYNLPSTDKDDVMARLYDKSLYIADQIVCPTIFDIEKMMLISEFDLLIIDSLHNIKSLNDKLNVAYALDETMASIKQLAIDKKISILLTANANTNANYDYPIKGSSSVHLQAESVTVFKPNDPLLKNI